MSRKDITIERESFYKRFQTNYPEIDIEVAKKLIRLAIKHDRLCVQSCNGCEREKSRFESWNSYDTDRVKQKERIEKNLEKVNEKIHKLASNNGLKIKTGGDPRGYTVKVFFPNNEYNTWGGAESGYGVPSEAIGS